MIRTVAPSRVAARAPLLSLLVLLAGCFDAPPAPAGTAAAPAAPSGFTDTDVFPGAYDTTGDVSRPLAGGPLAIRAPEIGYAEGPDGTAIHLAVVRPDTAEPVPVVAVVSPYFSPFTEARIRGEDMATFGDAYQWIMYMMFGERLVPHGYALALVAVRGSADSGGCSDLLGPLERADADAAITWLGTQPWSSGKVGMIGLSYAGTTPWEVAGAGNPYLATIVPIAGITDLHPMYAKNGTVNHFTPFFVNDFYYGFGWRSSNPTNGRSEEHTAEGFACPEAWKGFAEGPTALLGRSPWWDARNLRPMVEANYRGSVLLVHGLADPRVPPSQVLPWIDGLESRGVLVKKLLGQWAHDVPDSPFIAEELRRWDFAEILLRWFNATLKGEAVDLGPKVQVADSGGRWRSEDAWPPRDARPLVLSPGADGALAANAAPGSALLTPDANDPWWRMPVEAASPADLPPTARLPCPGCLVFAHETARELRFAGAPTLHLTVVPQGPGGHVAAELFVEDDATTRLVGRAQMDLLFAAGGDEPAPVVPGAPIVARMEFEPLDVVVPAGGRLVLALSQGAIEERDPSIPTYPVEVRLGSASVLTLATFERAGDVFFEPPR